MRKNTIKRALVPLVICLLIAAFFVWVEMDSYKRINAGVRNLEELEEEELEDYVVHSDVCFVLDCFAEYGDVDVSTGEITETDDYYYIIYYRNGKYIAIEADPEEAVFLDEICDSTWDCMLGDSDDLDKSYAVEGSISSLRGDIKEYYIEWFLENGWSEEEAAECALPYVLHIGWDTDPFSVYLLWSIALILVVVSLVIFIIAVAGGYQREIKNDFARLKTFPKARIEEDYDNAFIVNKRMRIGQIYTYDCTHFTSRAYLNQDILWVYSKVRSHRIHFFIEVKQSYQLILYDVHGQKSALNGNRKLCKQAMGFYEARFPHIVLGYSKQLSQMFFRDRQRFLALRYNAAQQNENTYERFNTLPQGWSGKKAESDNPYENPYTYGNNRYNV